MTNSDYLLMLFLLFSMNPDPDGFKKAIEKDREKAKQKDELQRSCPNIEWEQDMGACIPFCRLTNDFCDCHCM